VVEVAKALPIVFLELQRGTAEVAEAELTLVTEATVDMVAVETATLK
jgi:hypothetical protein